MRGISSRALPRELRSSRALLRIVNAVAEPAAATATVRAAYCALPRCGHDDVEQTRDDAGSEAACIALSPIADAALCLRVLATRRWRRAS